MQKIAFVYNIASNNYPSTTHARPSALTMSGTSLNTNAVVEALDSVKPKAKAMMKSAAGNIYTSTSSGVSSPAFNAFITGACICHAVSTGSVINVCIATTLPYMYAGYQTFKNIDEICNFVSKLVRG